MRVKRGWEGGVRARACAPGGLAATTHARTPIVPLFPSPPSPHSPERAERERERERGARPPPTPPPSPPLPSPSSLPLRLPPPPPSQLFAASGLESPALAADEALNNHMGLFLQKTNIVRDYLEDIMEEPAPR